MVFTNDELRNPVEFNPGDPMTWSVSDWETCWAMRDTTADNPVNGFNETKGV